MNAHTKIKVATAAEIAFDVETCLQRAQSYVRAILMASEQITRDQRDCDMLKDLVLATVTELESIDGIIAPHV